MDDLDQIPWTQLTHAYGSAEDVPGQLKALTTASPDLRGDDSPLWQLFGNIYHQGTVYEATSYAVPFLIDLAADSQTPDRVGILELLASIADGTSYHAVHDPFFRAHGLSLGGERKVEREKHRELKWVARAHDEVLAGFETYVNITKEDGDVRYAAANVLCRLRTRSDDVGPILRRLYRGEKRTSYRAGVLLLLGELGDRSGETLNILETAARQEPPPIQWSAAFSLSRLDLATYSTDARAAIVDAILNEDLSEHLEKMLWDVGDHLEREALFRALEQEDREALNNRLLSRVENCDIGEETIYDLLNLVFPRHGEITPAVTCSSMNPLQLRTVRALVHAMEQGEDVRLFNLFQWGLPDTKRELRNLAAGRPRTKIDESLPLLGEADDPRRRAIPGRLKSGDRIHHRYFGLGTVAEAKPRGRETALTVDFDEEGVKFLGLPADGSPLEGWTNPLQNWRNRIRTWFNP